MLSILYTIISFIVALAILIAVHEFGHFWVAKKLGVKVLRFSLGFGPTLWKKTFGQDKTEFVIAAVPLGGYVKMLDEREEPVKPEELHRAFNQQSIMVRSAIVVAGPGFNFIFAIFAYWAAFGVGIEGVKPYIGKVDANTPAFNANIEPDDLILSINKKQTPTWEAFLITLLSEITDDSQQIDIELIKSNGHNQTTQLDLTKIVNTINVSTMLTELGITPKRLKLPAYIGGIINNSPAQAAGFQKGDKIETVNGNPITEWSQWVEVIQTNPGQELLVNISREHQTLTLPITPKSIQKNNKTIGQIGAHAHIPENFGTEMRAITQYSFIEGFVQAVDKTQEMSVLVFKFMWKMLVGTASIDNLSGPVSIAHYAGKSAEIGFVRFMIFLAGISVSLGVLNLLPIPLLDGGHLFFYLIETIKGSPVSENVQLTGQKIGLTLLLFLMSLAIFKDFERLYG